MARFILFLFFIFSAFATIAQSTFEICNNGIDDDGDGLIDCADVFQCAGEASCSSESANFNCSDGIDNDGNGKIDCADDACDCTPVEICKNGLDDDGDGLVDCQDGDCSAVCETDCSNGIDDDNDGFIDYFDGDCSASPRQLDSLALVSLYHATGGDNWTRNDNWLTGPLDTWFGIGINEHGIQLVWLANNNLTGYIPSEIGELRTRHLNLSHNKLSGTIPKEIGHISGLDSLGLSNNMLTGNISEEIVNPQTTYYDFDLSNNMLTGSVPQSMKSATYLHSLNLNSNYLSEITSEPWLGKGNVRINSNKFTFEDILPILEREDYTSYGKQQLVGYDTTVTVNDGHDYTINLYIDQNVTDNIYTWFKNGVAIDTTGVNYYTITNISSSEAGIYTCVVTNPATGMDLYSHLTQLQVNTTRQPQTISFDSLANRTYGDSSFVLRASTTAGLPVTYHITEGEGTVITLKDSVVTIVGAGKAAIAALQVGNEDYLPATAVIRHFTIDKLSQKITFVELDSAWVGDTLTFTASTDTSLPVSFSVNDPYQIKNNQLVLTKAGQVTITAHQPGNDYYAAAPSVSQTIQVRKPLFTLSGQIWQQPNVPYVGKAYAVLYEADRFLGINFRTQALPESNTYRFDSLEAGKYTFKVSLYSSQYVPTYWGGHYLLSEAQAIQLQQDTTLNLTLIPTPVSRTQGWSTIRGRLVGPADATNGRATEDGEEPLAGVSVYLRDTQTGEILAYTATDETGAFAFTELLEGTYTLAVDYQGMPMQENTVAVRNNQETTILATVTDKITVAIEEEVITGLNDKDSPTSISVFPNPVTNSFVVQTSDLEWVGGIIRLQNILGHTVYQGVVQSTTSLVDVTQLHAGVYLLTVEGAEVVVTHKIVKQ